MWPSRKRIYAGLVVSIVALIVGFGLIQLSILPVPWTNDHGQVTVYGDDGTEKLTVEVEVADTWEQRYTGLSDHDSLEPGTGMLFVHGSEGDRTYVMRDMDFDIDIIFIDSDREITAIHHARAPEPGEDGEDLRYSGRAQWVLEVPRGTANNSALEEGDTVEIEYE
ncbi:DUF192 domain-containing protein [Halobacteria archaeon AArc-curdl1]|uniref:DUF192 domain-containing protein n=1 Tax=Natronosalvus hydrolyticus TaxID=2979988 RepID=A0AAP2Z7Q5_9EURY|nr:DUF192 domain-containing protein [Halobacteria archaeon AArc-curdl1]